MEEGFLSSGSVHNLLGSGKTADVLLWRNNNISACVLGGATLLWIFFALLEYDFVFFVCRFLIVTLTILFIRSTVSVFVNPSPLPSIPEIQLPDELVLEINRALAVLRGIALGQSYKKFFVVICGLWILSSVFHRVSFMTLLYILKGLSSQISPDIQEG